MRDQKGNRPSKIREAIIDLLVEIPIFDELSTNELDIIAKHMNFVELQPDAILFTEGDGGDYMCFVVNGILDVYKKTNDGHHNLIAVLINGRSIGEMSVIDKYPRSATVKARTAATLVILTREDFNVLLEKKPHIGIKILKKIARLLSLSLRNTSSRLADSMLSKTC